MKTGKRLLSLLLAVALVISMANFAGIAASAAASILLEDDFSGDLSKWGTKDAEIVDGKVQVSANGLIYHAADWTDFVLELDADFGGGPYKGISFRRTAGGDDYLWWFGADARFVKRVGGGWDSSISDVYGATPTSGTHHFKILVQGNTFYGFVDGQLVNTATDDSIASGGVLMMTSSGALTIDNVVVRGITKADTAFLHPDVPDFEDDFSSGLSSWKTTGTQLSGDKAQISAGGNITYIAQWTDFVYEVDADFHGGTYRGFSFRTQANGDDYIWWFSGDAQIVKRISGGWAPIGTAHNGASFNGIHNFKIMVQGNTFYTFVDGELWNTATDDTLTSGGVRVQNADGTVDIDKVTVREITGADTAFFNPDFTDDFSTDLSGWKATNAQLNDGKVQITGDGNIYHSALWTDFVYEVDADFHGGTYRGFSFRTQANGQDYLWWFSSNAQIVKRAGGWTPIGTAHDGAYLNGIHHFKIMVLGNTFYTFVDGELWNTATDDTLTSGGVRVYIADGTMDVDKVTVRAVTAEDIAATDPSVPDYSDDFSGDLSKWWASNARIVDGRVEIGAGGYIRHVANWTDYVVEMDADFNGGPYKGISFNYQSDANNYLWWFGSDAVQMVNRTGGWNAIGTAHEPEQMSGTRHLKLVVKDNTFYGFVDGELWSIATDDTVASGGILLMVADGVAYFDNLVVRPVTEEDTKIPAPKPLSFDEDFSGDLSKWVTFNAQIADGGLVLQEQEGASAWAIPVLKSGWADYTMEFDADFNGQPYRGIAFRRQANGDDYLWWFGDSNAGIEMVKRTGSGWTTLGEPRPSQVLSGIHHFKLEVKGNTFKGYVDGALWNVATDDSFADGGVLLMVAYDQAWFDNVTLRSQDDVTLFGQEPEGTFDRVKDTVFSGLDSLLTGERTDVQDGIAWTIPASALGTMASARFWKISMQARAASGNMHLAYNVELRYNDGTPDKCLTVEADITDDDWTELAAAWQMDGILTDALEQVRIYPTTGDGELGAYYLDAVTLTAKRLHVTVSCNVADVTITGTGYYYPDESVTVTAPEKEGFNFIGWYAGNTCLTQEQVYTFVPETDMALVAVYEAKGMATLEIECTDFTLNGDAYAQSVSGRVRMGTEITLKAEDSETFLHWKNGSGKIVSTDPEYTFVLIGDTHITGVRKTQVEDSAYVEFVSAFGQVLRYQLVTGEDEIVFPAAPSKVGSQFTGWSMTEDEIRDAITAGMTHIQVTPVYSEMTDTYTVTLCQVADGTVETVSTETYTVGAGVTATAPEAPEGMKFSHWAADAAGESVLGTGESYFLQLSGDRTLYAIYVADAEQVQLRPVMTAEMIAFTDGTADKLRVTATRSVPEGYTVLEHGIAYGAVAADALEMGASGVRKSAAAGTQADGVYYLNISVGTHVDDTLCARGYMYLKNEATGETELVYSNVVSGSFAELIG